MNKELLDLLDDAAFLKGAVSFDIESTHPNPEYAADIWRSDWRILGVGVSTGDLSYFTEDPLVQKQIAEFLWTFEGHTIGHNLKFDLMGLKKIFKLPLYPKNIFCTMIAQNVLDENLYDAQIGLKPTVKRVLGHEMLTMDEVRDAPHLLPEYCKDDARQTFRLYSDFVQKLSDENLFKYFSGILMPMVKVVCDLELYGFGWDLVVAEKLLLAYQAKSSSLEKEIRELMGNDFEINLESGDQLSKKLFQDLGLSARGVKPTKSGKRLSVDGDTLDMLASKYPVCKKLSDYRHAKDMLSKYLFKITSYALDDENHRVHPSMWLTSATSRTRMTNPPNQTIPKKPKLFDIKVVEDKEEKDYTSYHIRSGFKARPNFKLIVSDFSQFQLRLCAHISGDPEMSKAYLIWTCKTCDSTGSSPKLILRCPKCGAERNENILKDPLAKGFWHGLDLHQMTYEVCKDVMEDRQDAKTANFALIFLASSYRMNAEYPKFSLRQWDEIIERFFLKYQGVRKYHRSLERLMNSSGIVTDIFGRKRRIMKEDIKSTYKHCLNQFVNFPVQSSEVGYAELCCATIREKLIEEGLWNDGCISNFGCGIPHFMHDEIVLEVPDVPEIISHVSDLTLETMRFRVALSVPVDAELKVKSSW